MATSCDNAPRRRVAQTGIVGFSLAVGLLGCSDIVTPPLAITMQSLGTSVLRGPQ